jgi:hypothetical protein
LGSAHSGEGGRGEVSGPLLAGRDERWAENRKKMIFLFFFFSNFSKQIFKRFSNPNLNLNQTTHLKNLNATA